MVTLAPATESARSAADGAGHVGHPRGSVDGVDAEELEGARVDRRRPRVGDGIAEEEIERAHQRRISTSAPSLRKRAKKPGKETSAHSAPEMVHGSCAASAATEKASAMR